VKGFLCFVQACFSFVRSNLTSGKIIVMKKLTVFNFTSLNGYFEGSQPGDISWNKHGAEEAEYSAESLKAGNTLLFGRVTYELMADFWPTPFAQEKEPVVAEGMNKAEGFQQRNGSSQL
jgi:dihydrofolate reductase